MKYGISEVDIAVNEDIIKSFDSVVLDMTERFNKLYFYEQEL
jgi:hypothetical protein